MGTNLISLSHKHDIKVNKDWEHVVELYSHLLGLSHLLDFVLNKKKSVLFRFWWYLKLGSIWQLSLIFHKALNLFQFDCEINNYGIWYLEPTSTKQWG